MMKKYLLSVLFFAITTANAQDCSDPGRNTGDTGCVTFTYKGQSVNYSTVRGSDGNIWLQQNLGSSNVATTVADETSYGDLFQWGRWDDGHQNRTSVVGATPTPNNPLGILEGSSAYHTGWWSGNALTDTWQAPLPQESTATNGCDPCKALGEGWKLPAEADWDAIVESENMANPATAFGSLLKLPANGYRSSTNGSFTFVGTRGYYWSSTASSSGGKYLYIGTTLANPSAGSSRGQGAAIRCMKYKTIEYCDVSVDYDVEPISSVDFADLNNTSSTVVNATPAYEDFTSMIATVAKGETYTITIKGNTAGTFTHDIRIFIDWNKDGEFDMNTEYYPLSLTPSTGSDEVAATEDILVPADAVLGNTRMRITKDQWNIYEEGEFDACTNAYYGQVEDYTLKIEANLSVGEITKNSYKLYPNPTNGIAMIQSELAIENVSIYNQLGQLIASQKSNQIDLSKATNGLYVAKIKFENGQTATQKIIKK